MPPTLSNTRSSSLTESCATLRLPAARTLLPVRIAASAVGSTPTSPGPSYARLSKALASRRGPSGPNCTATCCHRVPAHAVTCAYSAAGNVAYSLPSRSWIRPARRWRCTAMPTWFGRSLGHAKYSSCRVLPVASARTRSPKLGALGLLPADLFAAALGDRPWPRLAVGVFASAATADVVLLPGGVLLTRVSTRSAISRSVSRVATAARSVSRRASRSLIFVFSALIWSSMVGVVLGMVALPWFHVDRNDQSCV